MIKVSDPGLDADIAPVKAPGRHRVEDRTSDRGPRIRGVGHEKNLVWGLSLQVGLRAGICVWIDLGFALWTGPTVIF